MQRIMSLVMMVVLFTGLMPTSSYSATIDMRSLSYAGMFHSDVKLRDAYDSARYDEAGIAVSSETSESQLSEVSRSSAWIDTNWVEVCGVNCDFEYGNMHGWEEYGGRFIVSGVMKRSGSYSIEKVPGSYAFFQRSVSIQQYADYIDAEFGALNAGVWIKDRYREDAMVTISFLNSTMQDIGGGWSSGWVSGADRDTYYYYGHTLSIPKSTRYVRFRVDTIRTDNDFNIDVAVDDISIQVRMQGNVATVTATGTATGTATATGTVTRTATATLTATQIPTATKTPTTTIVYGFVVSATTGSPISNVRVCVTSLNTCVVTNSRGAYELRGLSGVSVNVSAAYSGYITSTSSVSLGSASRVMLDFALSPVLTAQSMRIVLSWGLNPRDLDSHLWIPTGTGGYSDHIFYRFRGSCVTNQLTCLDVDDTSSYGPETITINRRKSGTYVYGVHHFSGLGSIAASSSAQIDVYAGSRLVRRYRVPANANRSCVQNCFWTIFRINGSTGAITDVNKFTQLRGVPLTPP